MQMDDQIFFQRPEEKARRVLHPAQVVEPTQHINARLDAERLQVAEGDDLLMYFEQGREFMRQDVRVTTVREDPQTAERVIGFQVNGPAVSAESRQCYRVSTIFTELKCQVGGELCDLTDVSMMGFSVIAEATYDLGHRLDAVLYYDGHEYAGECAIQSVKQLVEGMRYGILPVSSSTSKVGLPAGLQKMTTGEQREQLRRMAGA